MYGSAGHCAALVLQKMGCEVIALRCEANGQFPEHAPDPSQEKHLRTFTKLRCVNIRRTLALL